MSRRKAACGFELAGRRVMRGTRVDFTVGAEDAQGEPVDDGAV